MKTLETHKEKAEFKRFVLKLLGLADSAPTRYVVEGEINCLKFILKADYHGDGYDTVIKVGRKEEWYEEDYSAAIMAKASVLSPNKDPKWADGEIKEAWREVA